MDTILNLGLNEEVVNVIAEKSNNPRWAWDCYRRFIQMYSDVVMEVGKKYFEELIDKMKAEKGVKQDVELTADDLKELANQFKAEYKSKIGSDFPQIRRNSSWARSRPYSVPGTTRVPTFTVVTTISRIPGVQLLTYSPWHSVTWVTIAVPVLPLPVTLQPVRRVSSVSS
jgi:pyruvate,orthophosphate dikinase